MKKILISDYDGTFNGNIPNEESIRENTYNVSKFMNRGNIFAFATGRSFVSIKSQTNAHFIPYDYLICNNGTSIFGSNDELLHYNQMPISTVIKTINYLNKKHIILDVKYNDIFGERTSNASEVAEIICTVKIPSPEELEAVKDELNFLQVIFFSMRNTQRHTVSTNNDEMSQFLVLKEHSDKKEGIRYIADLESISKPYIYTVGNDFNDFGMLQCYNGYKMIRSSSELELLDVPEVESVSKLVRKL